MLIRLTLLLVLTSFIIGCHLSAASPSREVANSFSHVKLTTASGDHSPIPLGNKLTVVNLFYEFSAGCPTGNRFEALERFHSLNPDAPIVLIFSGNQFSTQDIDNFKAILPMPESLVQGDIEAVKPHLISGKLLVVLDSTGNVIWHERAGMSEQQVMSQVGELLHSASR
ncbi:MAG TPA: hypothetical protein VF290_16995 [Pyrinomonadaceae bacterium]